MALETDELAWVRARIGDEPPDADLHAIHDRVGTREGVAREVLLGRLQALRAAPAQFTVPGEYSQNTGENIKALERAIAAIDAGAGDGLPTVTVVPPPDRPAR